MTAQDLATLIAASADEQVRIVAGQGADRECGWASLDADGGITVGWDSGVRTPLYDDAELA